MQELNLEGRRWFLMGPVFTLTLSILSGWWWNELHQNAIFISLKINFWWTSSYEPTLKKKFLVQFLPHSKINSIDANFFFLNRGFLCPFVQWWDTCHEWNWCFVIKIQKQIIIWPLAIYNLRISFRFWSLKQRIVV